MYIVDMPAARLQGLRKSREPWNLMTCSAMPDRMIRRAKGDCHPQPPSYCCPGKARGEGGHVVHSRVTTQIQRCVESSADTLPPAARAVLQPMPPLPSTPFIPSVPPLAFPSFKRQPLLHEGVEGRVTSAPEWRSQSLIPSRILSHGYCAQHASIVIVDWSWKGERDPQISGIL